MTRFLVTVTGPSASGKTEIVHKLVESYGFEKLVSVTTRQMRPGEIEGKDYYFISPEEFEAYRSADKLVQSVHFNGKDYGTTTDEVERVFKTGNIPIVIVEPGGVEQFKRLEGSLDFKLLSCFVIAPYSDLERRFLERIKGEPSEYDLKRLKAVRVEYDIWPDLHKWMFRLQNPGNDKKALDFLGKKFAERVSDLREQEQNVASFNEISRYPPINFRH